MIALWLLAACTPDTPTPAPDQSLNATADTSLPPPDLEPVRRTLDDAVRIGPPPDGYNWGYAITVGSDLDHDGVMEWAATNYRYGADGLASVHVYEGEEEVTSRTVYDHTEISSETSVEAYGQYLDAGGDANGDGFADLLISDHRLFIPSRTHVVLSTSIDDDWMIVDRDPNRYRGPLTFFPYEGVWGVAISSHISGIDYRLDVVRDLGSDTLRTLADQDVRLMQNTGPLGNTTMWDIVPLLGLGTNGGRLMISHVNNEVGGLLSCSPDGDPWDDHSCVDIVAEESVDGEGSTGRYSVAFHTRSGQSLYASAGVLYAYTEGALKIYDEAGSVRATIHGTKGAAFGAYPTSVVDDQGDAWLVVTDRTPVEAATIYAFHPSQLHGDLVDTDALRQYTTGQPGKLDHPTPYRATPDSPLQLLATDHQLDGEGVVYLFDW